MLEIFNVVVALLNIGFLVFYLKQGKKTPSRAGFRVTFSATVPTSEESQYLLDHILKIRHPQNGSYVMYDVDFKIDR